jgi:uncharacterized membrane protein YkvA (DUF1232 family)
MKTPWSRWFRREKKKATRLLDDPVAVIRAADTASAKAERARGPLAAVWDDLRTSIRLVRVWARRDYSGVSRSRILLIVAALLYLVSPIDAIVDTIPVLGLIDDAAVLAWALRQVRLELDLFRQWEARQVLPEPPIPLA